MRLAVNSLEPVWATLILLAEMIPPGMGAVKAMILFSLSLDGLSHDFAFEGAGGGSGAEHVNDRILVEVDEDQ